MKIKDIFRQARPPKIKIVGGENLPPEKIKELEEQYRELLLNGRPPGMFREMVRGQLIDVGRNAPVVIEDSKTGTIAVPADFEGLVVHLASWDSMLLPEELQAVRDVLSKMIPMGLNQQHETRKQRAELEAENAHMKEHHPEDWQQQQGWRV
jgi:hypothetical protein